MESLRRQYLFCDVKKGERREESGVWMDTEGEAAFSSQMDSTCVSLDSYDQTFRLQC